MRKLVKKDLSFLLVLLFMLNIVQFNVLTVFAEDTLDSNTGKQFNVTFQTVCAGSTYTMGIGSDEDLYAWGDGYNGELGNGSKNTITNSPIKIMTGVASVSTKAGHTMALRNDGSLWVWGKNGNGQVGNGTANPYALIPTKIMDGVKFISAGDAHSMAIKNDGSLWVWGDNSSGQIGDGTKTDRYNPVKVMSSVIYVSAGGDFSEAIRSDGSLWTWGDNSCGQLCDGTMIDKNTPIKIMDNIKSVSAGWLNTLIIKNDDSLWRCGYIYSDTGNSLSKTSSQGSTQLTKIMDGVIYASAGIKHSMAIKTDGSLWGWGWNSDGQIGDGTTTDKLTSVKLMEGVSLVSAGWLGTMAIKSDGSLWGWGFNGRGGPEKNSGMMSGSGSLGDGTYNDSDTPVNINFSIKVPSKQTVVLTQPPYISVGEIERLSGASRYETAAAISKRGWTQSDNVVLACGDDYHDALVGSSFAYLKGAPILTTDKDSLNSGTATEIQRLGAKTVYIIGNTDSVSQDVEDALKQKYTVVRISGESYKDTAMQVAEKVTKLKPFDTIILATQSNFPDALAIAPFSAMNTMPIIFVDTNSISSDVLTKLQDWGVKNVIIVGGTGVISDNVDNQLKISKLATTRLCGADRYATALEIIKYFEPKSGYKDISIATGENYPDALAGAVLAAKLNIPIVIVSNYGFKDDLLQYLKGKTIGKVSLFGGSAVINDGLVTSAVGGEHQDNTQTVSKVPPAPAPPPVSAHHYYDKNGKEITKEEFDRLHSNITPSTTPIWHSTDTTPGMTIPPE